MTYISEQLLNTVLILSPGDLSNDIDNTIKTAYKTFVKSKVGWEIVPNLSSKFVAMYRWKHRARQQLLDFPRIREKNLKA